MSFFQVNDECNGCLACIQNCPAGALKYIDGEKERKIMHNITRCARCGHCWRVCPQNAVEFQHLLVSEWDDVTSLELVHCSVCGEPLYPVKYHETLAKESGEVPELVCPKHRKSKVTDSWKYTMSTPNKSKTVPK